MILALGRNVEYIVDYSLLTSTESIYLKLYINTPNSTKFIYTVNQALLLNQKKKLLFVIFEHLPIIASVQFYCRTNYEVTLWRLNTEYKRETTSKTVEL